MAYAAVISLKQTIHRLLNSSRISIVSSARDMMEFAYKEVESLQQVLKRSDDRTTATKRLNALEGEMRDAVQNLEDLLEIFYEPNDHQFVSQSESCGDDEEVRQGINSFAERAKKMAEEYVKELDDPLPEEEDDEDDDAAAVSDIGVKMVGLSDEFTEIKAQMLQGIRPYDYCVAVFVGKVGTGRTAAALGVFNYLILEGEQYFSCWAWMTIGPDYELKDILRHILAQIIEEPDELLISEGDELKMCEYLYESLKGRKYMIALDDVCDAEVWEYLRIYFPQENNGSIVLLTTALEDLDLSDDHLYIYKRLSTQTEKQYWDTFCLGLFGAEGCCPPELEEAGKKIVQNCKCLYMVFFKVLLFLAEAEKSPEYWNKLAADEENSIFTVADEVTEMSKINEDMHRYREGHFIRDASSFLHILGLVKQITMTMFPKRYLPKMETVSFFGMAGIGKTTLVREIFEDPSILHYFKHHVWITLGQKYQSAEILVDILAQIYPDINKKHMKEDGKLAKDLGVPLSYESCLIVLDDVWNIEPLHFLKNLLPNIKGKILMTTRLAKLAKSEEFDRIHEIRFLNKEESWCLLRQKVFAKGLCPVELEKPGKKIAENCEGLPLTIVTIANLLSKAEKTPKYWNKVAEKRNSVFMNAYSKMSKILLPSYNSLPQHLKACFFYMGVFLQNYEISRSNLIKLWIADGFLEPNLSQTIEDSAIECLLELVDRSLVMVCQKGSNFRIKTCRLHSVFWHLSNSEAVKNRFFHALDSYTNNSIEGMESHRRLCVRNNILFGIKDVHNSMTSFSTTHSLLCTGPPHQYPVPIYLGLRLLRVMETLGIHLYEFPNDVVKQTHLRYLALNCNEKLPTSISKLWNLHYLIVSRNLSIKSSNEISYLPIEVWDMKELKHLQIMGSSLPNPSGGTILPNLLTLLGVSANNCTEKVLEGIPNLKRLGIQIELAPDNNGKFFYYFDHISSLNRLESLKCVVVNPELRSKIVASPTYGLIFPSNLKKMSLSGLGYPWEYMNVIGKLKNLEVLKLRCYAFRGREWEANYFSFFKLKFLLIEDTDLVHWKLKIPCLSRLLSLSIKHCYKLEELPYNLIDSIEMIEVVDCSASTVTWAKQMQKRGYKVQVYSS